MLDDSDEEKESNRDLLLVCVLAGEYLSAKKERTTFYVKERIEWEKHIQQQAEEVPEAFLKLYRIEYSSFMKLCAIISPKILVKDEMARRRTGKDGISIEIMLHCLLRWLSGGSYLDIMLSAVISPVHFYTSVYKCIDAILESEDLAYKFPNTEKELDDAAQVFKLLSHPGCNKGVCCMSRWVFASDLSSFKK